MITHDFGFQCDSFGQAGSALLPRDGSAAVMPRGAVGRKARTSFLKKRSKKLFPAVARCCRGTHHSIKSFLVLFFKKEHASCAWQRGCANHRLMGSVAGLRA